MSMIYSTQICYEAILCVRLVSFKSCKDQVGKFTYTRHFFLLFRISVFIQNFAFNIVCVTLYSLFRLDQTEEAIKVGRTYRVTRYTSFYDFSHTMRTDFSTQYRETMIWICFLYLESRPTEVEQVVRVRHAYNATNCTLSSTARIRKSCCLILKKTEL